MYRYNICILLLLYVHNKDVIDTIKSNARALNKRAIEKGVKSSNTALNWSLGGYNEWSLPLLPTLFQRNQLQSVEQRSVTFSRSVECDWLDGGANSEPMAGMAMQSC